MPSPASVQRRSQWQSARRVVGNAPYLPSSVVRLNEPLSRHTTLRIGGRADLYVEAGSPEDLKRVLTFAAERERPVFLLGAGSNVVFSDDGFRGVVVRLGPPFCWAQAEGNSLEAGGGAPLHRVLREAYYAGLSGLEFLSGVPGTVGGALAMNAGTKMGSIGDVVHEIRCFDRIGNEKRIPAADAGFRYRGSNLDVLVIVAADFELRPERARVIAHRVAELEAYRNRSQPRNKRSAGCVFKNPPDAPAGKLLDELGFKGKRIGGARVSMKHANFILTDGSATRRDFDHLMEAMRTQVRERYGFELEPEVLLVGPFGPENHNNSKTTAAW
jgi:UDP-N-acetylenolpyruvoylglucosamine reductase